MRIAGRVLVHLLLALALPALRLPLTCASAQSPAATLTGRVVDPNRAIVIGATVDATNEETNVTSSTETNAEGLFVLPNLPTGRYRIIVQKRGFQAIVKPGVELHVQDVISINFTMDLGSVIQSLTIQGGIPINQSESATVNTLFDRKFVENLPLNGRSFQSLITLIPGVVLGKSTGANPGQFSINGQRTDANYFTVDGVSANTDIGAASLLSESGAGAVPGFTAFGGTNNLVSVDALQEFKVQTSSFAPEFGRTPGGQISIVTRSGTNDFHGGIFDYFRNDVLDATDWFANRSGQKKPPLRQNDFGGVFGGPLRRNHTFFFLSYEGLRLRQPQTAFNLQVPSLSIRSSSPSQIRPFLNAFPLPNGSDLGNGLALFSATYSNPSSLDAASIRIDHSVNNNIGLFARYNYAPSSTLARLKANLSNLFLTDLNAQTLTGGSTFVLSPHMTDEFRINYSRSRSTSFESLDSFGGAVAPPDATLFPSFASPNNSQFLFVLSFSNRPSFTVGGAAENLQRQTNLVDNLSVVTGPHQLKFGIDYRRLAPVFGPEKYLQNAVFMSAAQITASRPGFAGITAFERTEPVFNNFSAFAEDTWHASRRLTLTYGLRWDLNPPPSEANGNDPFVLVGLASPATATLGTRGTPLYKTTYTNFAPRAGGAYRLSERQGRETVLRGGFGIFYDLGNGQTGNAFTGFPFQSMKQLLSPTFPLSETLAMPAPFSTTPSAGSVIEAFDPNLKLPRTFEWNIAVEQSLGNNQSVSAAYVGATGDRLLRHAIIVGLPASLATSQVFETTNAASSSYHALQVQFQRRLSSGLQALASYTWAHSIDSASDEVVSNDNVRGPSDFDVRHTLSIEITYNLPGPRTQGFAGALLRNWSVDSIFIARTATPVNVLARAFDNVNGIQTSVRPNLTPGIPLFLDNPDAPGGRVFNNTVDPSRPGCKGPFCAPPIGVQGTLGRNALRGFGFNQIDLALRRKIVLTERWSLQVRAEAFNLLNHPNFGDPNNLLTNALFGQSTTMFGTGLGTGGVNGGLNPIYQIGGPRSMQLALKLQF